jgi:hypothetical protein
MDANNPSRMTSLTPAPAAWGGDGNEVANHTPTPNAGSGSIWVIERPTRHVLRIDPKPALCRGRGHR